MSSASSVLSSRPPGTSQARRKSHAVPIGCNSCRKALGSPSYMTRCGCIFCNECAMAHFVQSSSCPRCRTTLGNDDVWELAVAEPKSKKKQSESNAQDFFTKSGTNQLPYIAYSDLCHSVMRHHESNKENTKFLLMQLLREVEHRVSQSGSSSRHYQGLKQEHAQLQKNHHNLKLQYQEEKTKLEQQIKSREATNRKLEKKIQSMEKVFASRGFGPIPSSPQPQQRQSQGLFANPQSARAHDDRSVMSSRTLPSAAGNPPLAHFQRSTSLPHHQANVTPIQLPPGSSRPFTSASSDSGSIGRVRQNVSASSGYNFQHSTGHVNKRRRESGHFTPASTPMTAPPMSPTNAPFRMNRGGQQQQQRGLNQFGSYGHSHV